MKTNALPYMLADFSIDKAILHEEKLYKLHRSTNSASEEHHAILFKTNHEPRVKVIESLYEHKMLTIQGPEAFGYTQIENKQRLCLIIKPTKQFQTLEQNYKKLSHIESLDIITELANTILQLHNRGIVHGCINLSNIYLENNSWKLKECYTLPCGYAQQPLFETIERMQCSPIAKSQLKKVADWYALGVVAFVLASKRTLAEFSAKQLLEEKLRFGTTSLLEESYILSGTLGNIVKNFTDDDFKYKEDDIEKILNGIKKAPINIQSRPIIIKNIKCYNKRSIAYHLFTNWEDALECINKNSLINWLEHSDENSKIVDALQSLKMGKGHKTLNARDIMLSKIIYLLNPSGLFRYGSLSFDFDNIGNMFNELIQTQNPKLRTMLDIIESDFLSSNIFPPAVTFLPQQKDLGFGIMRENYNMNPLLPCQSAGSHYITTLEDAIAHLNNSISSVQDIAAKTDLIQFISSKINLKNSVMIRDFTITPAINKSTVFKLGNFFFYINKNFHNVEMPQIIDAISKSLVSLFRSHLKSEHIKENISTLLPCPSLAYLYKKFALEDYIGRDQKGYMKAKQEFEKYNALLGTKLDLESVIFKSRRLGTQFALVISYIFFIIYILSIML